MSYETPWRSLGETARNFRNADKSEGNCITCWPGDTTGLYHGQGVSHELDYSRRSTARLKGNGKAQRDNLCHQCVDQRLRFLQIARVEPLSEPAIGRSEKIASLILPTLIAPQPRHAHRRTQFPGFRLLLTR